jgi:hypothetical protein
MYVRMCHDIIYEPCVPGTGDHRFYVIHILALIVKIEVYNNKHFIYYNIKFLQLEH